MDDSAEKQRQALAQWLEINALRVSHVAKKTGVPYTTIDSFLNGKTRQMTYENRVKIAEAYGLPVDDVFDTPQPIAKPLTNNVNVDHNRAKAVEIAFKKSTFGVGIRPKGGAENPQAATMVPVVGVVQAGAYVAVQDFDRYNTNADFVPFYNPRFARATVLALRISGDSIDLFYKDGSIIFFVPAAERGLRHGQLVVARKSVSSDLAETTVKELRVNGDQIELWPRSTNPKWSEPYIIPPRNEAAQDGVEIIGVVINGLDVAPEGEGPLVHF